jgi:hypothetical protein
VPHRWVIAVILAAAPLPLVLGPDLKTTFYLGDLWDIRPYPLLPILVLAELAPIWWSQSRPVAALAATGTAFLAGQAFDLPATRPIWDSCWHCSWSARTRRAGTYWPQRA